MMVGSLRIGAVALAVGLLLVGACEPSPAISADASYASRQNHNLAMADRLKLEPVRYPLSFVLISDTHYPVGEGVFARLREQMLQLSPRPVFSINVGDATEGGTVADHVGYLSVLDDFPIPFFTVIGNHEMYEPEAESRQNYATYEGPEDFSFDYADSRFIALNDIIPRRCGLTDQQISWLEQQLATAPPNRFVFMHSPPPVLPLPEEWVQPPFFNIDRFYELVERYGVKLVVSGHVHEYRYAQLNGVDYVETGGGGGGQDARKQGLRNPPYEAVVHNFVRCTIQSDGDLAVELFPLGDYAEPDSSFTLHLRVSTVQP